MDVRAAGGMDVSAFSAGASEVWTWRWMIQARTPLTGPRQRCGVWALDPS
jgi:hypothetical protein